MQYIPSDNIYVTDTGNQDNFRVQKFDSSGKFITSWGTIGNGSGQLQNPAGIAVDSTGNVYVVDADNQNVKKFDDNGKFITKWGSLVRVADNSRIQLALP